LASFTLRTTLAAPVLAAVAFGTLALALPTDVAAQPTGHDAARMVAPPQPGHGPGGPGAGPHGGPPGLPPGAMMPRPGGAQVATPTLQVPPGFSGQAVAQAARSECAVTGLDFAISTRRSVALIDMSVRVRTAKGGYCVVRPDAVQITTSRSVGPTRILAAEYVDGQVVRPFAVADAPAGDRFSFWSAKLNRGEEKVVSFRYLVEGDISPTGEVDAPARLRLDPRFLGPKFYEGAVATATLKAEPGQKGRLILSSGNPKVLGMPQDFDATGRATTSFKIARDAVNPLLDWRLDQPGVAPVAFDDIGGGLGAIEYLRDGLVRELAAGLSDPKDKAKVDAAWDHAFEAAWVAASSPDPLIAGLGARALAWLANDLAPNAVEVKGALGPVRTPGFPARLSFETGKAEPSAETSRVLARIVELLKGNATSDVVITPPAEKAADAAKTKSLAADRGKAIKKALVDGGIAASRISVKEPATPATPDANPAAIEARTAEIRLEEPTAKPTEPPPGLDQLADQSTKALGAFAALSGVQGGAPAVHTSRSLRPLLAKIAEQGSHRKDINAAMKRLVERIKEDKLTAKIGEAWTTAVLAKPTEASVSPNARQIQATLKGTSYVGGTKAGATPRSPMAGRIVREIAGHRGLRRAGLGFVGTIVLVLLLLGALQLYRVPAPKPQA
jgi:outer membrane protein OmpA-like peptidoglycan-associated protein